jgi:hypothetical protein
LTSHIIKIVNEAVEQVPDLARSRFAWLKNPENFTKIQAEKLGSLPLKKLNLKISRAYHIKLNFQEIFN